MKKYKCEACGKEFDDSDFDDDGFGYASKYKNSSICCGCCLENDPSDY